MRKLASEIISDIKSSLSLTRFSRKLIKTTDHAIQANSFFIIYKEQAKIY